MGDVTRLRQVLVNLIDNALKFTHQGQVHISCSLQAQEQDQAVLEFQVMDTGIGMSAHVLQRLFQPFSQADTSTTRRYGGTGLGLAICARLVALQGGDIQACSQEGKGSTFTFTIRNRLTTYVPHPMLPAGSMAVCFQSKSRSFAYAEQQLEAIGITCVGVDERNIQMARLDAQHFFFIWIDRGFSPARLGQMAKRLLAFYKENLPPILLLDTDPALLQGIPPERITTVHYPLHAQQLLTQINNLREGQLPDDTSAAPDTHTPQGLPGEQWPMSILVADDNDINQKLICRMLEKLGYTADIAASGLEVLESLQRKSYDLLLLDLQMPEMDGLEAARYIRKDSARYGSPILMAMTANVLARHQAASYQAGIHAFLSKPVKLDTLEKQLHRLITQGAFPHLKAAGALQLVDYLDMERLQQTLRSPSLQGPNKLQTLLENYHMQVLHVIEPMFDMQENGRTEEMRHQAARLHAIAERVGAHRLAEAALQLQKCDPAHRDAWNSCFRNMVNLERMTGVHLQYVQGSPEVNPLT
ncbi:MAG: response regulator [Bacteroidetes bacterium]|nr:response regulator [Bacteroidota bacterium]